jgi:DNA-binding MarR family transcriptional regulator
MGTTWNKLPDEATEQLRDGRMSVAEWTIFALLCSLSHYQSRIARTSAARLAHLLGLSPRTVQRALKKLHQKGWITLRFNQGANGPYYIEVHLQQRYSVAPNVRANQDVKPTKMPEQLSHPVAEVSHESIYEDLSSLAAASSTAASEQQEREGLRPKKDEDCAPTPPAGCQESSLASPTKIRGRLGEEGEKALDKADLGEGVRKEESFATIASLNPAAKGPPRQGDLLAKYIADKRRAENTPEVDDTEEIILDGKIIRRKPKRGGVHAF